MGVPCLWRKTISKKPIINNSNNSNNNNNIASSTSLIDNSLKNRLKNSPTNIKSFFILVLAITGHQYTYKINISECNDLVINVPYEQCYRIDSDCAIGSIRIFQIPNSRKQRINLYTNVDCKEDDYTIEEIPFQESGIKISDPLYYYLMILMGISIILVVFITIYF
ncbi:hypothetical protein ACTFIV_001291 [Dictyostelium citrinum]